MPSTATPPFQPAVQGRLLSLLSAGVLLVASAGRGATAAPQLDGTIGQRALACAACHGEEGRATRDGYFPRIAGKPAGYLYNQLINFREGRRQYPPMTYMVRYLSDDYLKEMAEYFSGLDLPYPPPEPVRGPKAESDRGASLVTNGDLSRGIPACMACHGEKLTGTLPAVPSLVGLSRHYLNAQFGAWRSGARKASQPDCMAAISRKLTPDDISAITSWLAAQPVPADTHPIPSAPGPMPLPCGVVAK